MNHLWVRLQHAVKVCLCFTCFHTRSCFEFSKSLPEQYTLITHGPFFLSLYYLLQVLRMQGLFGFLVNQALLFMRRISAYKKEFPINCLYAELFLRRHLVIITTAYMKDLLYLTELRFAGKVFSAVLTVCLWSKQGQLGGDLISVIDLFSDKISQPFLCLDVVYIQIFE